MASNTASVKVQVEGEKEFQNALQKISAEAKALDNQMKAVTSGFDKTTTAEEKTAKTTDIYNRQVDNQNKRIKLLNEQLKKTAEVYGEDSKEANELRRQLYKAVEVQNKQAKAFEEIGKSAEDSSKDVQGFANVFTGNLMASITLDGLKRIANGLKKIGESAMDAVKGVARLADELNTQSKVTGVSTESLQEWAYRAKLIDVDVSTITASLKKLTTNMNSATKGSGTAFNAFKTLGVSFQDASGNLRDNEDVFLEIVDALGKVNNEAERDALRMALFGKSATDLNPLILAGSDALAGLAEEAHQFGYVLDQETLDAMGAINDDFDRLGMFAEGVKNHLGVELAPVVQELTTFLLDMAQSVDWEEVGETVKTVRSGIVVVLQIVIGVVTMLIETVKAIVTAVKWVVGQLPTYWSNLVAQVTGLKTKIKDAFDNIIKNAKTWGTDMIQGFIDGIKSKVDALLGQIKGIADSIRSFLHFSHPDKGALKDYETWMPDFMEGLAKGIESNMWRVTDAMGSLTDSMMLSTSANGSTGGRAVSINLGGVTFNGYTQAQGKELVRLLNKELGALYNR